MTTSTQLLLGVDYKTPDGINILVPKVGEIAKMDDSEFAVLFRPFTTTLRELFSFSPDVDKIEEEYVSIWQSCFNREMDGVLGQMLGGASMISFVINGLAYWTGSQPNDFQVLSNQKIVNKAIDIVIDESAYNDICEAIAKITFYKPNDDLIAPKGMSDNQKKIWESIYQGRVRKLKYQKSKSLGDKILILSMSTGTYIPFEQISNMTYYQFQNLFMAYIEKDSAQTEFQVYLSQKFDTKDMKIKSWREEVALN